MVVSIGGVLDMRHCQFFRTHKRIRVRRFTVVSAVAAGLMMVFPSPTAAADPTAPGATQQTSDVGTFATVGDYVHISRATDGQDASAHGWWQAKSGPALKPGAKAKVTVWLQAQDTHGKWKEVAKRSKTVLSGGGTRRSHRATARKACQGPRETSWRSIIDVDFLGGADSPRRLTTSGRKLKCGAGL
ncbi:hypothetical protein [Streptomyces sp. H27-D2]|uniref:hypothetical protein n=1 Tax=Streptomyces sp. H27-D2 TaxID=3046304 RepID=UPI002DB6D516|nr:hypothetical protein [Streptomyces sp. H27-D2]MEC4018237.1 hypothetical protein [Streptomyces sp. H27-D2]